MNIFFDSNVWEKIITPEKCNADATEFSLYDSLQKKIKNHPENNYWISVVYFPLEQFSLKARAKNWKGYKPEHKINVRSELGQTALSIMIGPSNSFFDGFRDTQDSIIRRDMGERPSKWGLKLLAIAVLAYLSILFVKVTLLKPIWHAMI